MGPFAVWNEESSWCEDDFFIDRSLRGRLLSVGGGKRGTDVTVRADAIPGAQFVDLMRS